MAGKTVEVLVTPTGDMETVRSAFHGIKQQGSINIRNSLSIAQLVLKHRQNKAQR